MVAVFIAIVFVILVLQDVMFLYMAPRRLDYSCVFDRVEAWEGDSIHMVETVENRKPLPVLWLMADIHTSPNLDYGKEWTHKSLESQRVTSLYTLGGRTRVTRTWNVSCLKRGVINIEYVTLIWGGLLGYRLSSQAHRVGARLVVYPGLVDIDDIFVPRSLLQSDCTVRRFIVDDPFLFAGIREYTPTDPLNRIHWSSTARHGNLMVRQNSYTAELTVLVALNIQSREFESRESLDPDSSELGIKVAASVAEKAIRNGALCALATNASIRDSSISAAERKIAMTSGRLQTVKTPPGSGQTHLMTILGILARLACVNHREFAEYLDDLALTQRNSEIVVVSAYLNDRLCGRLEALCAAGNAVRVLLLSHTADTTSNKHSFPVYTLRDGTGAAEAAL